jgi:hypothetical protein
MRYDLLTVEDDDTFQQEIAGRLENGEPSTATWPSVSRCGE